MSVPAAYLGVMLIWCTTPLAIKWSAEGAGFLFAAAGRMVIGAVLCVLIIVVVGGRLPWDRAARETYASAAIGTFGSMLLTYWGAQYVSSGLISVLFGLAPVTTGLFATWFLREKSFSPNRVLGMALGVLGLALIFGAHIEHTSIAGLAAVLGAVLLHSGSAVAVKRVGAGLSALTTTAGALLLAVPAYLVTMWLAGSTWPEQMSDRAAGAIIYLGVFGSVIGFMLYFYALQRTEAGRMALINLVTPVAALLIGQWMNAEQVEMRAWFGTALIMLGIVAYEWAALTRGVRRSSGRVK